MRREPDRDELPEWSVSQDQVARIPANRRLQAGRGDGGDRLGQYRGTLRDVARHRENKRFRVAEVRLSETVRVAGEIEVVEAVVFPRAPRATRHATFCLGRVA